MAPFFWTVCAFPQCFSKISPALFAAARPTSLIFSRSTIWFLPKCTTHVNIIDGFVIIPISALRSPAIGLNVPDVRLAPDPDSRPLHLALFAKPSGKSTGHQLCFLCAMPKCFFLKLSSLTTNIATKEEKKPCSHLREITYAGGPNRKYHMANYINVVRILDSQG